MIAFISPVSALAEFRQSALDRPLKSLKFEVWPDLLIELRPSDEFRRSGLVQQLFTGCAFQTVGQATWKLFAAAKARRPVDVRWWRVKFRITTWPDEDEDWLLESWGDRLWTGSGLIWCSADRYASSLAEDVERDLEEFFNDPRLVRCAL
jgi:hypothetical protein